MRNPIRIIVLLTVLLAFLLRFWHFQDYFVFSLEENNILYTLESFANGSWSPLVGQEATGYIHHLFHSPWYIYFSFIIFNLFKGEPLVFGYLHITLGVLAVLIWFFIGKTLKNTKLGIYAAFITAVSFKLISIDRSAWAVGMIPFATTLSLLLFSISLKKKSLVWLFILGCCLGFMLSLHYQVVILIFLFLMLSLFKFKWKGLILLVPVFISLLPLAIFDLKHQLFNTVGMYLAAKTILSGGSPYSSNHYLFFLYPFAVFISAWILSKVKVSIGVTILLIFAIIQFISFFTYKPNFSYPLKNKLVNNVLDNYQGKQIIIHFKAPDSFEYKYLFGLRAKERGISVKDIIIYEPWQSVKKPNITIDLR